MIASASPVTASASSTSAVRNELQLSGSRYRSNLGRSRRDTSSVKVALQALRRALEIVPGHRPSRLRTCWALALDGQHQAAAELLRSIGPASEADTPWFEFAALVAGASGDPQTAARHYEALERLAASQRVPPWSLARAAAAARRHDAALTWLEAAAREHAGSLPFLWLTPAFDTLHAEARFLAVAAQLPAPQAA